MAFRVGRLRSTLGAKALLRGLRQGFSVLGLFGVRTFFVSVQLWCKAKGLLTQVFLLIGAYVADARSSEPSMNVVRDTSAHTCLPTSVFGYDGRCILG